MSPSLPEDRRSQLDGIVQQMTQNGEPDENISAVVSDFKQKYAAPPTPEGQFSSAQRGFQNLPPTTDQGVVPYLQQVGQNIWGAVKGTAKLASDVLAPDPYDPNVGKRVYQPLVQPQLEQFQKAGQAITGTGEFAGASPGSRVAGTLGYGAAGVLPGIGPLAARAGEKAGKKDYTGAAADITTAAGMAMAPEVIGDVARAAAGKIRQFTTPNPDTTFYQALGQHFRQEMPDYYEMSPIVRGDIKRAAQQSQGAPPSTTGVGGGWQPITPRAPAQLSSEAPLNDIPSTLRGTQAAKAENRAVVDMHVDPFRQAGWTGHGNPIADEIINSIPATLRARAQAGIPEAVAEVNRIVQEANVYRRPFTPDEIFGLNREFNAGLNNFFNRTADQQHALIGKGGDTATLEAAARGTRKLIRDSFGDDVANLQRRWGWLDDVETALRQKWKAVTKSPEETPASDLDAAMLKAGIPGKLTHGDVTGAKYAWRGGKTDSLLQDTFNQTEPGWPLPTPQPSGMPGAGGMPQAAPPARQLPRAPLRPAGPQRSGTYVSSTGMPPGPQQNVWQGIGAPRQLPAGSPTQGQGVIQVPPAGAANTYTGPRPNPNPELTQIPPSPRTAAPPEDTSFFRVSTGPPLKPKEPIVQQMGKAIWEATKPTETAPPPAPAEQPAPIAAPTQVSTPEEINAALGRALSDEGLPKPAPTQKAPSPKARQAAPGTSADTRLDKAIATLNEGMAKTRQAPPGTPAPQAAPPAAAPKVAPKRGGLEYPEGWDSGPADKYFNFQRSNRPGEEPYVYWKDDAPMPERLSDAQISETQRIIDATNARTPGLFKGIQDRLDSVKYSQGKFGTPEGRARDIHELLHSVSPILSKQILEAGP